ncbi:hypothetical protein [Arthrobacter sp. SLBN-112]|jgi:ABC-type xylose transport system permease subunit|uniref:hypothetical protein n=1 Tax=Arthrobacter sp. SLBN-112 TaxID=2768452 RepID=UPI0027B50C27|nr:hypothetical protein [Arthrobacter sp. SLBN-112]MDQ0800169.1 ABC-type xylose transport system permease subunit [Arthrobacter sp. SLBN-112]
MADRTSTGRSGNVGSAVVNALFMYGINIWPGWQVLPFLTADMARALDLINASLIASIVVGVVCVLIRARAFLAMGNLVALGFGMAAIVRVWEVFPFDFTGGWTGWPVLVRVLLVIAMVGSVIGAVAELVNLVRALAGIEPRPGRR